MGCDALMEDVASPHSLSEWGLFQDDLKTTFGAWRQQLRLSRALDLMSRGLQVALVSAELGYGTPAAFSTMFKRVLGVPPSRFPVRASTTLSKNLKDATR